MAYCFDHINLPLNWRRHPPTIRPILIIYAGGHMHLIKSFLVFFMFSITFAALANAGSNCTPENDVLASLRCIDGTVVEEILPSTVDGYRQFEIKFAQPVKHHDASAERFNQRLVVLHRSWDDPMVLQTSGYQIFGIGLSKLARTFNTNQIQIEHRFFAGSTPENPDWADLNIEESATDFHRITLAFKQLYRNRWVGTGASKGGMTSSYHRRFYPRDLNGTVADVAPLSFSDADLRYVSFVDAAGGARYEECRAKLEVLQNTVLNRYNAMLAKIDSTLVFSHLGSAEVALEHAVIEMPFIFWQYGNPEDPASGCTSIPGPDATDDEVYAFFSGLNNPADYSDDSFNVFQAYYFQAGTQLGGPGSKLNHLRNRHHPYSLAQYMPIGVRYTYSNAPMRDIASWVQNNARGMMFIYGEFDPWSAAAYPQGNGREMYQYVVPGGNHGSRFDLLGANDKATAIATLAKWFNRPAVNLDTESVAPSLDDIELLAKRQLHLQ